MIIWGKEMEVIVIILTVYLAFKYGISGAVVNIYTKSTASAIVQSLLEHQKFFEGDPHGEAIKYIDEAWEEKPDIFNGKFGQRPHRLATAIYTLALALQRLEREKDNNAEWVLIALGNALSEIEANGSLYLFKNIDRAIIENSIEIFSSIAGEKCNKYDKAISWLIQDESNLPIQDNSAKEVIVMDDFPYNSFEESDEKFRREAAEDNDFSGVMLFVEDLRKTLLNISKFHSCPMIMKVYTIMAALFIVATLPMPYEFYVSLRMLISIGLFIFLYALNKSDVQI